MSWKQKKAEKAKRSVTVPLEGQRQVELTSTEASHGYHTMKLVFPLAEQVQSAGNLPDDFWRDPVIDGVKRFLEKNGVAFHSGPLRMLSADCKYIEKVAFAIDIITPEVLGGIKNDPRRSQEKQAVKLVGDYFDKCYGLLAAYANHAGASNGKVPEGPVSVTETMPRAEAIQL